MLENKVLMKTYKDIKKEYKQINVEREYENDNYLIQTLKRTTKSKYNKEIVDYQNNIKKLLTHIYNEIQLLNDPKVKKVKEENDIFQKEYKSILDNFQKSSKYIFKDIIGQYNRKGYKLPEITCKHNLFKINALIEENNNKLELILREDKKNQKNSNNPTLAMKTLAYLKKLNLLLNILLSKEENKSKKLSKISIPKFKIKKIKNESIEELKNSINKLRLFIKSSDVMNSERKKSLSLLFKRKSTYGGTNSFNTLNLVKSRNSKEFSNINTNIDNKTKTEEAVNVSDLETEKHNKKYESSNFLLLRQNTIKSNKSNLTNNTLNEIINGNDKKRKEDTIYCTPFDINSIPTKNNTKKLINLKKKSININITNIKRKEKSKTNIININENNSNSFNKRTSYSNIFSKIKRNSLSKSNNKYLNTYTKKYSSSLKKNIKIDSLKKLTSEKIKTSNNLKQYLNKYIRTTKTPKIKTAFFLKTQSLEKKSLSRNKNYFLSQNKSNTIGKTQKTFLNKRFKTQEEYLESAYKRLKNGNFENLEELIRKYLKEVKQLEPDEEDFVISHYNYKNLKSNLTELNEKICGNDLERKTERIYFNNHVIKRILPLLKSMKEKESNIDRFEKIVKTGTKSASN